MGSTQSKHSRTSPVQQSRWLVCRDSLSSLWFVAVLVLALVVCVAAGLPTVSAHNTAGWLVEQADLASGRPTPGPVVASEPSPLPPVVPAGPQAACSPQSANAPADWPLLLCDAFDDDASGWQVGEDIRDVGTIKRIIADGLYTYDVEAQDGLFDWSTSALGPLGDFYVAVDARAAEGAPDIVQYGLRFRYEGFNQAYMFLVSATRGFMLTRLVGEMSIPISWTPSAAIQPNDWNRVAVKAVGPQLIFYINDQQVAEFTDEAALAGQVALVVRVTEPGRAVVQFDNFEVRSTQIAGAPTAALALALSPTPEGLALPTPAPIPSPMSTTVPPSSVQVSRIGCPPSSSAAPADWPVTICDTFDDNTNGWDEGVMNRDEGRIARTVADGVYTWDMEVNKFLYVGGSSPLGELIDFYAAVDVRVVGDPQVDLYYALEFRRQDVLAFYMFQVSNNGMFRLWRWIGDSTFPIDWTPSPAVRPNDWNRIAVKAIGPQLTFYVNDQPVGEYTDNVIMAGRFQLVFALQEAGHASVQFDNFEVRAAPYSGVPTFAPPPTAGPTPTPTDTPLPPTPPPPPKASAAGCPPSSAVAPADWPLLICDTFDDNARGWATDPACDNIACNTWTVANGVFAWNINAYESHHAQRLVPLDPVSDFYAAVDVYVTGATVGDIECALKFRMPDPNNYYSYNITFEQLLGVFRNLEGESTNILIGKIPPGVFRLDDWNRLAVMAVGPSIVLYVNDHEVGRVTDPFVSTGQFMLSTVVLKPGHFVAYIDNFEVRQAPPGAQPPPTPRKVITSCPNSPAIAPADWPILACETFDENTYGWWVGRRSLLEGEGETLQKIDGGAYVWVFKSKEGVSYWAEPQLPPVSDFFASVQAKRISLSDQSGYGLIFRMKDGQNYFVFRINDLQQYEVLIWVNGFSRRLVEPTQTSAIWPGETNTLAVKGEGRHFTFYINDQQVGEVEDIHFREGQFALVSVIQRNDEGRVEFDNFEVRTPNQ